MTESQMWCILNFIAATGCLVLSCVMFTSNEKNMAYLILVTYLFHGVLTKYYIMRQKYDQSGKPI